ncbi:hypothetical protein [Sorangium sp. So ce854]|uniref:hypothetical protein n=1 Tax=Sorangium sp. So ce854 TaxID=3133322 RepID=UPI003F639931
MNNRYVSETQDDVLGQLFQQEEFIQDARDMVAVPDDVFEHAIASVENTSGFLGPRQLVRVVAGSVADAQQRRALVRFLINFNRIRRDAGVTPDELANDVAETMRGVASDWLTEEEMAVLASRVRRIVQPKQALERQVKAEQVVRRVGVELDEFVLVCDLRPIFDEDRERVEGMIPVTTMRVVVSTPDSLPTSVECRLTEKQVNKIYDELERARRKLDSLKRLLGEKDIVLPESSMTVSTGDPTA